MSRRPTRRPSSEEPPRRRRGRREGELTVDELAAQTGMTVRNVRAYSSRGLLPPPRLEGRTGYYGPDHVARLTLVREMLDQGYTLAAAEKLITAAPGSGTQALGLYHALMSPWDGVEEEVVEPRSLAREAGIAYDPELVRRLVDLDLATETEDLRLRIANPTLVRAGLRVIAAGVPAERVLDIVPTLRGHADAVSRLFVQLIWDSLWKDFVDAGMPARQWPRMQQSFEEIIPLAGQALLAAFQDSLGTAITTAMRDALPDETADDDTDPDDTDPDETDPDDTDPDGALVGDPDEGDR
ncbi:MerR family transcriptional regulator [Lapillicoccus jejuensis]|uniref:MerR-like DNA binding protein n=1 Tax=Lapillicoccus jejuensis TaxID=402171 RepID=A0A542E4R7_9MICO|nr:MerR family transcriptional regulator [Lapillicoccus jejuensis]TQJ10342.1 MerR-like DNA binding protein [Lapillicoccus jejuensis]